MFKISLLPKTSNLQSGHTINFQTNLERSETDLQVYFSLVLKHSTSYNSGSEDCVQINTG